MRRLPWMAAPLALLGLIVGCGDGGGEKSCSSRADCDPGELCIDSRCVAPSDDGGLDVGPDDGGDCPPGFEPCAGRCIDPMRDPMHCGGCGMACEAPPEAEPTCELGVCSFECPEGRGDCNGVAADGCETDVTSADLHCGACGDACDPGLVCDASSCVRGPFGDGSDGELVVDDGSTSQVNDVVSAISMEGGSDTVALTSPDGFEAGQLVLLHQSRGAGAGRWAVRRIDSVAEAEAVVDEPVADGFTTGGGAFAQAVVVPEYTTVSVSAGTIAAPEWTSGVGGIVAFAATESVTVGASGVVEASNRGYNGPATTLVMHGVQGEGPPGGGMGGASPAPEPNGSGGGGGVGLNSECNRSGGGGGGGYGTAGQPGDGECDGDLAGSGGMTAGDPMHAALLFGGAGGSGGGQFSRGGGDGGGIVYIATPELTVEGTIHSDGGDGVEPRMALVNCFGGGGGGAGGAIHLRTTSAALGDGLVTAAGGAGGSGPCAITGGDGGDGRIVVRGASSPSGTTIPSFVSVHE